MQTRAHRPFAIVKEALANIPGQPLISRCVIYMPFIGPRLSLAPSPIPAKCASSCNKTDDTTRGRRT